MKSRRPVFACFPYRPRCAGSAAGRFPQACAANERAVPASQFNSNSLYNLLHLLPSLFLLPAMLSLRWPGLVRPMGGMARAGRKRDGAEGSGTGRKEAGRGRKRDGSGRGRKRDGSDIAKSGGFSACPHSIADLSRFPLWPAGMAEGNRETFGPRVGLSSHGSPAKGGPKSKCVTRVKIAPTSARLPSLTISCLSRFPLPV